MPVDLDRVLEGLDEELDPNTQQLIDELSEELEPGEDWLHYDRDRLFPPPEAPPSEAHAHLSVAAPSRRDTVRGKGGYAAQGNEAQQRAEPTVYVRDGRRADTIQVPRRRFIPENARQARAVRRQQRRRLVIGAVLIAAAVGLGAVLWQAMRQDAPPSPADVRFGVSQTEATARTSITAPELSPRSPMTAGEPSRRIPMATPAPMPRPVRPASPAGRSGATPAPLTGSTGSSPTNTSPAAADDHAASPSAPSTATASAEPAQRPIPATAPTSFLPGSQRTF